MSPNAKKDEIKQINKLLTVHRKWRRGSIMTPYLNNGKTYITQRAKLMIGEHKDKAAAIKILQDHDKSLRKKKESSEEENEKEEKEVESSDSE